MADGKHLEQQFHDCMPLFIALGDEVRLGIIETLTHAERGGADQGLNVNEITQQTSLSRPAVSHHLKILRDSGLVEVRRCGTSNFYRLTLKDSTRRLMDLGRMVEEEF
ncbi:MAG: metalloregulator ArsR/SmtB family transcription factor [Clostridiales bacterium]|nr:metalloregulator ArsR/SmtB family transcription factor [Clostridiales bacterium]MCD8225637.1 metalloregulator ArsR/SmtB family transcription factor [Clostridiales bacterium]